MQAHKRSEQCLTASKLLTASQREKEGDLFLSLSVSTLFLFLSFLVLLCERGRKGERETGRVLEREGRGSEGDRRKRRQEETKENEKERGEKKRRGKEEEKESK